MTAAAPEWNTSLDAGEEASFGYVPGGAAKPVPVKPVPAKPVPANVELDGATCTSTGTTEQNADAGSMPAT